MTSTALILFGRYPHPGKVKTRLAAGIGDNHAAGIYKACCEHFFSAIGNVDRSIHPFFFFSEASDGPLIERWVPPSFTLVTQHGTALGSRMKTACAYTFEAGFDRCVIMGTDVPDVSVSLVQRAIDALDTSDLVIGPSQDGGYYLLGTRRHRPELFDDIPWSSGHVLTETIRTAQRLRLSFVLLPELIDLDTAWDLRTWVHARSTDPEAAYHPVLRFWKQSHLTEA